MKWFLFLFFVHLSALKVDKVVIWGCKLHSHTHSYIHYGFDKAFRHLGYKTYWFDENDNVSDFDFKNTLFITVGLADKKIPVRDDCYYLLHNPENPALKEMVGKKRAITFQVYTHDVLPRPGLIRLDRCTFVAKDYHCVYMPWATDLLPHEIDAIMQKVTISKERVLVWVGTYNNGSFGNYSELQPFIRASRKNKIGFRHINPWTQPASMEENIELIQKSYLAPAIVGAWQKEKGYIPCRIFKNISYGRLGITNSQTVFELFEGKVIYNSDTEKLFYDAYRLTPEEEKKLVLEQMQFVKERHTYLN